MSMEPPEQDHQEPKATDFRQDPAYVTYVDEKYIDPNGNPWIIQVSGLESVVQLFVKEGHVFCVAESLDQDTWQKANKELRSLAQQSTPSERKRIVPSFVVRATLQRNNDQKYLRFKYNIRVPYAGNSLHEHTVDVGGDAIAHVTFVGNDLPITVHMGGASATAVNGSVDWETRNTTIGLSVYEEGTTYSLNGDGVHPPA